MNTGPSKGYLIIDATHGGIRLANEYKEKHENVFIYDIYNTLNPSQTKELKDKKVKVLGELDEITGMDCLDVIYPIHLPLKESEIAEKINNSDIELNFMTHHEAVKSIADDLEDILKIEITGVKGKTSSSFILKEIFKEKALLLSSVGIYYEDELIERDISITPANTLKLMDIAKDKKPRTMIIESSLGTSAIGEVCLLTNIVENYPIANNLRNAKQAKSQVFNSNLVAVKSETLFHYYKDEYEENKKKINTFSIDDDKANVFCRYVKYGLRKTEMEITYNHVRTVDDELVSGKITVSTFAPSKYHVENILGAVCVALSCKVSEKDISEGLNRFKGLIGRTNIEKVKDKIIIKEINPGINTKAIEYSLDMIENPEDYDIVLGGDYGITCEEINEESVIELMNQRDNLNFVLTGELGKSIWEKNDGKFEFVEDYKEAVETSDKNILFIYRSDYRKLNKR